MYSNIMNISISCMCLTYGRPHLLEEAIYSFLNQKYNGKKELVVLNDLSEQTLKFDHPEVKIINLKNRVETVGEKRNICADLCTYDNLAVWDDDDIYLSHRLSFSAKMMENKRYFKPTKAFYLLPDKTIKGPVSQWFTSGGIWQKSLFIEAGKYAHMGSRQDSDLERKFIKILGSNLNYENITPEEIYYLYRCSGNSYHLSVFGRDIQNEPTGNKKVEDFVMNEIKNGFIATGDIYLNPRWKYPYDTTVKKYIDNIKKEIHDI